MEFRSLSVILVLTVLIYSGQTARPKATVTIQPADPVFIGETVTLTCDIRSGDDCYYDWFKDSKPLSEAGRGNKYTIYYVAEYHRGDYTCKGRRSTEPSYSETSDAVTLTVSDLPKPTLTVEPERPVFSGESVTLKCEIKGYDGWTYQWYKQDPWGGLITVPQSVYYIVNGDTLTIRGDAVIHGDQYWCSGQRRYRPTSSEYSNSVTLTVKEKPKPELTSSHKGAALIGKPVVLYCKLDQSAGWRFYWFKHTQSPETETTTETHSYTISSVSVSEGGQYWCRAGRGTPVYYTHYSDALWINVTERPKAVVSIQPGDPVFIGETVTLRCDIQGGGVSNWQYSWFKDDPYRRVSNEHQYSISSVTESHRGKYTCSGTERGTSRSSHTSDAVTLTVSETPKPELTSSHKGAALIGNPVVLYCELDQSAGWRFYWSKHTQSPENETKPETDSYTISSVSVSDGGQYWCRAGRGTPVYYTHYSDALWINVTGMTRSHSLTVSPSRAQHFSADSLSLSCERQSDSTGWRVRRYTHSEKVSDCSSGLGSVTGSTCNISSLSTSHTGVYGCESESGESSNPVNITVTNGAVILDSPVHPVTEGDPLTLHCLYRDPKPSNLTAEFYKDGSLLQTQTTGEMTIRTVSKSDEGLYHCKHPEKGESPQSWISVRGASFSVFSLLSSLMAVSPYLLVTIVLGVKCYRAQARPDEENKQ
ncbi:leukocyte immunoglobulin-like receptor subfamily A member 3 [Pygocentrus nattereri]|uniref:leukocyte immunoglobulin-like receptor subfamily A member 3 n=1 Tax=Pygocentrus nattereri TaxID=42514 RepID=UPI001890C1CF|nr:leukocyte immunoglobulin-like receptor subfamily A member 3 [Pygocentrus nattereri]